jgi:spore coat polysaccharide biosynthesis protein SpsF
VKRKLVAALACRNQGTRLYGKPLQNLDIHGDYSILDNVIRSLQSSKCIDEIVLGISEGVENDIFKRFSDKYRIDYIVGSEHDVLSRLIECGKKSNATDIFRVTSESPFRYFELDALLWEQHLDSKSDATFLEDIVDGCGFEIICLDALKKSHENGEKRHKSELCTKYIRENPEQFNILRIQPPENLIRKDLRLTVDYPEDLVVCRNIFMHFRHLAPNIPVADIIGYLDDNPSLIQLISPFTESGYSTMYL